MAYPGGKNGAGVFQKIINQMPPHDVYIEPFLGGGAVMDAKRPALRNIGIDIDSDVIEGRHGDTITAINADAISFLPELVREVSKDGARVLVYADPPYLGSARVSARPIYQHEMLSEEEHLEFLSMVKSLGCMVMVSGYESELYARELEGWRSVTFQAMTRGGFPATEWLWMNFPEPFELHDYRYLGENFRERERIKRQQARWRNRLEKMPALERYAILQAVNFVRDPIAENVDASGTS